MHPTTLIIFARYPAPGRAKTRLVPALGERGAARLQDAMTGHTLREAAAFARGRVGAGVEVRFTGATADAMAARYGRAFAYAEQGEGGLGERLARAAVGAAGDRGRAVILVGTDCPGLTADHLARAADALATGHDLVAGPAADGGYYLLGVRRPAPELFAGIEWGTGRVLGQTLAAADRLGLSRVLLPTLADVDVPADLPGCRAALPPDPPAYAPQRIAITGATGCLGRHFLERVVTSMPQTRVTAVVRSRPRGVGSSAAFRQLVARLGDRLTWIEADLRELRLTPRQRRALAESDGGLWHFAACTSLRPSSPAADRETREVNEGVTAELLGILGGSDRPGPLFHVSTAYVCGRRTGAVYEHELDGSAGFRNGYEQSKHAAESRVRAAFDAGLAGAVLRPSLVVADACGTGPGDVVDLLAAAFVDAAARADRRALLPMPATAAVNAVPAEWVARMMLALGTRAAQRGTYHLTASRDTTVAETVAAAEAVYGPLDVRFGDAAASRWAERAIRPFRPYFDAGVRFDRTNLELDVPDVIEGAALDLPRALRNRAGAVRTGTPAARAAAR